MNVQIWVMENPNSIFYYVEHARMDLNLPSQDDISFTFGIQTPWQAKMMTKFEHKNSISFDATLAQTIATLALGSRSRQRLTKVHAKSEARESLFMLMGV
jgi:hypothetical protein